MIPNLRLTPSLFDGTNYREWTYSATIGGVKRLGYIDGSLSKPDKDYKYSDWLSENMLIINWLLNSMEESIASSFRYFVSAKELWEFIQRMPKRETMLRFVN